MKFKKRPIRIMSAMLAFALLAGVSEWTAAQETRPRYNSQQQYPEQSWTLPPDTVISVQMNGTLTSRTAHVGDKFTATVTVPVYANGRTVIPAGSIVEGRVTQVTPAKRMSRPGSIAIDFDNIVFPNGQAVGLVGILTSDDPETRRRIDDESRVSAEGNNRTAVFIGGGGAIGAVLGGIAGGGKGAVLGGVAGAGAGVASVLLSKGEEAQVPSGTPFGVQIKQGMIIRESYISEGIPPGDPQPDRQPDQLPDRRGDRHERPDEALPENRDRPVLDRAEPEIRTEATPDPPLSSTEMVRRAQEALKDQGYYEGVTDGVMSPRTSGALRAYQRENKLQETGDLDPPTAQRLGIVGGGSPERTPERPRETGREPRETGREPRETGREPRETSREGLPADSVMANVISASANRTQDGAISVLINTQANTGGWRWFGEQVVNGDTLEVYARAVRPTGMVTQALTRGRIEVTVRDGVEYVRRVVVHSASGAQVIALGGRSDAAADPSPVSSPPRNPNASANTANPNTANSNTSATMSAGSLQRRAEDLLSEYQRVYGIRMTGNGVELDNPGQYREAEIELLFAIDSFVNATQLYSRLTASLRDRQGLRSAALSMARQARRTDRVISTTTSRSSDSIAARWDAVRQDVLRIMQAHNISSSEVED